MNDDFSERIEYFNKIVTDASTYTSIARARELQEAAKLALGDLLTVLRAWKEQAVTEEKEDQANLVLAMECVARALEAELSMWLLLKEEKPEDAWDQLIEAQTATGQAVRAHRGFAHMEKRAIALDAIEKLVFPPQIFFSAGMIVRRQTCTICNKDYEECDHLVGMPYWGEFCFRRLSDVTADHIAIVTDPANKRCRMTHFGVEGGKRNRMTWRIEPVEGNEKSVDDAKGRTAIGIIMTVGDMTS